MAPTALTTTPAAETPERRLLREYLTTERQTLIMRLRKADQALIEMGVISEPTIKTRDERRAERHGLAGSARKKG